MSKHPRATREDHDDFCTTEGWILVRGATGKPVQHHRTYELALPDGSILRSRPTTPPRKSLPLYLVEGLAHQGLSPREISAMTEEEATERLQRLWSGQDRPTLHGT